MASALDGLKVVDLTRYVAGPLCGMMLGDMGADVVKIEKMDTGEDIRGLSPKFGDESLFLMAFNRNKRSLGLELRDPRAQDLVRKLAGKADILIENFRPGVMEAMGCGWDVLMAANPRLIMGRISGYGQDGPYAQRPCFDAAAQAASGLMHMTGAADGPPTIAGTTVIDHTTGMHALIGILAALEARHRTGRGQMVDVALLDSAVGMLMTAIPAYAKFGIEHVRQGNRDRYGAPSTAFPTADGRYVYILAGGDDRFARFARAAGLDHVLEDPRFETNDDRLVHIEALEAEIIAWSQTRTADDIVSLMADARVPCDKAATIQEVMDNPQLRHRGQIIKLDHPEAGTVPMQGFVAKFSETRSDVHRPVPQIGQHSAEVLAEWLGYNDGQIAQLSADGVI